MIAMIRGIAWKFGDDISTDLITPGRYYHLRSNLKELAEHAMEDADPSFTSKVNKGDFIVAGKNFGLGSSREHAPLVIKLSGVSAVIAKSFARIFYRNSINVGLPVIMCETDQIELEKIPGFIKEKYFPLIESGVVKMDVSLSPDGSGKSEVTGAIRLGNVIIQGMNRSQGINANIEFKGDLGSVPQQTLHIGNSRFLISKFFSHGKKNILRDDTKKY